MILRRSRLERRLAASPCAANVRQSWRSAGLTLSDGTAVGSSRSYRANASAGASDFTSPRSASWRSVATAIDSASTWKCRRSACRVSATEAVGAERGVVARYPAGDQVRHRAHPVGHRDDRARARRQRLRSRTAPAAARPGCSRFRSSHSTASRRSSVQEVADQTSAATPQSCGEQLLRLERPLHAGAGGEDLCARRAGDRLAAGAGA